MIANKQHVWSLLACASWLVNGVALPKLDGLHGLTGDIALLSVSKAAQTDGFANGIPLRIMPLGASITYGQLSSHGNGYRKTLRDALMLYGNPVNMVGFHPNGTMKDNENEGWPGFRVAQVHAKAKVSVPLTKPNLILVNAGTNDCVQKKDMNSTVARLNSMLKDLYKDSPKATIVLSTLLPNSDARTQKRVLNFNSKVKTLVKKLQSQGKRIVLADMQGPNGIAEADLVDGTHPDDEGYRKMATIWLNSIGEADQKFFLQKADHVKGYPDSGPS